MSNMMQDDSAIVEDILQELNSGGQQQLQAIPSGSSYKDSQYTSMTNDQIYHQQQRDQMARQMDPNIHPELAKQSPVQQKVIEIDYDSEEGKFNRMLRVIKKPLIVLLLVFIVFNPVVLMFLARTIPSLFNTTGMSNLRIQVRTLTLALMVSILYYGTNYLF